MKQKRGAVAKPLGKRGPLPPPRFKTEPELPEGKCAMCLGKGWLYSGEMNDANRIECWTCKGTGLEDDVPEPFGVAQYTGRNIFQQVIRAKPSPDSTAPNGVDLEATFADYDDDDWGF